MDMIQGDIREAIFYLLDEIESCTKDDVIENTYYFQKILSKYYEIKGNDEIFKTDKELWG